MITLESFIDHRTLLLLGCLFLIALTALLSELSGVINIALEGQLTMAVFIFTLMNFLLRQTINSEVGVYLLSFLISFLFVFVFTLIFASLSVSFRMDPILVGLALNIIVGGIAAFVIVLVRNFSSFTQKDFISLYANPEFDAYLFEKVPFFIHLFAGLILAFIVYFFVYWTTSGLRIRAAGHSAKVMRLTGLSVQRYRYLALLLGSVLITFAGLFFIEAQTVFSGTVFGYGFIGLAILNLANHRILLTLFFTFLFVVLQTFASSQAGDLYVEVIRTTSYLLSIVALFLYGSSMFIRSNWKKWQLRNAKTVQNLG